MLSFIFLINYCFVSFLYYFQLILVNNTSIHILIHFNILNVILKLDILLIKLKTLYIIWIFTISALIVKRETEELLTALVNLTLLKKTSYSPNI